MLWIPVWYECLPPNEPGLCYLFRDRALMGQGALHDLMRQIGRAGAAIALAVYYTSTHFGRALMTAGSVRDLLQQ